MKVKAELSVGKSNYYRHLVEEITKDIKKNTDKEVTVMELEDGYEYKKKMLYKKKPVYIKMKIGPLMHDKFFIVRYETDETECMYSYDFVTENEKDYVIYTEENDYKEKTFLNKFGTLKRNVQQKSIQKRMLNNIELTETYIKNHSIK